MSWKKDLAFFALTLVSIVLYFVLAANFGLFQRIPILHILLALIGVGGLAWGLRQEFRLHRVVFLLLAGVLSAGYIWYTLDYSNYEARESKVTVGDTVDGLRGLELTSHRGDLVPVLATPDEAATLLVFYRGFW